MQPYADKIKCKGNLTLTLVLQISEIFRTKKLNCFYYVYSTTKDFILKLSLKQFEKFSA